MLPRTHAVLRSLLVAAAVGAPAAAEPPRETPAAHAAAEASPAPETAATRTLRVVGRLDRVPGLGRGWQSAGKKVKEQWYREPSGQGVVLLFAARVRDAGGRNLPVGAQQPVCWCVHRGGCVSLRTLSLRGECGRLETPGDGAWERHFSGSQWKTLPWAESFVALTVDLPPSAKAVELSILANDCGETGSFMFPVTSTHTGTSPGTPAPFYLAFSPRESRDFTATLELRILTDNEGNFDVELKKVWMDDRDPESRAAFEACVREHGDAGCRYVTLEEDPDGNAAGAGDRDSARCE